jgi:hypothetical protein
MNAWINRLSVNLYKRRWFRERWARRFRPVLVGEIPWRPLPPALAVHSVLSHPATLRA